MSESAELGHKIDSLENDHKTRWRVTDLDWKRFNLYDKFRK